MPDIQYDHIIVRYGELSTKGKNRKEFTKQLTSNIHKRLKDHEALTYNMLHDGLFIKLNGEDYEVIKKELKDVFGYAYFAGAIRVSRDIEDVKKLHWIWQESTRSELSKSRRKDMTRIIR